jgi:GT2 family glycosyltransferase
MNILAVSRDGIDDTFSEFARAIRQRGHSLSLVVEADSQIDPTVADRAMRIRIPQIIRGADALRLIDSIAGFAAEQHLLHLRSDDLLLIGALVSARLDLPAVVSLDRDCEDSLSASLLRHVALSLASKLFCAAPDDLRLPLDIPIHADAVAHPRTVEDYLREVSDLSQADRTLATRFLEILTRSPQRPLSSMESLRELLSSMGGIRLSAADYLRLAEREQQFAQQRRMILTLSSKLKDREAEIEKMTSSMGWKLLERYGRFKYRYLLPLYRLLRLDRPRVVEPEAVSAPRQAVHHREDFYSSLTISPELAADESLSIIENEIPARRRDLDVISFSIIDWEFRYQRPQQIMSQFALTHRVFYISPSRFLPDDSKPRYQISAIRENVYEVRLALRKPPDLYTEPLADENLASLIESLEELRAAFDIDRALSYVMIASWTGVAIEARQRWGWPIIYDCMDEWETFPHFAPAVIEEESLLVGSCDLLVVTAQRLGEKWKYYDRPTVLARNGVDYRFYAERCLPNSLIEKSERPAVGYYGAIADWFDLDLMAQVASARPDYDFILIGGVFDLDLSALEALPNVRLLGHQPYERMPEYLYHFDACIIPFKINAVTEATDPVKLYEYLSAGKAVVSVALPEIVGCGHLVYIARSADEFAEKLDGAIVENDPELIKRRKAFARQNTWESRHRLIEEGIRSATPRASIIVVTYNNLAMTRLCLESVIRNTHCDYEIIVVDNDSMDGTQNYLRRMADEFDNVKAILNNRNEGFARANNQGIRESEGRYIILLNNDTITPPGWLRRLIAHLKDPRVGLVGPLTNSVGNEARVEVAYRTWGEMEDFAWRLMREGADRIADIRMLAMFCVAMRREVYEEIGPLDEQFGIGMFEDDDYSHRVKARGYRVVCAADAFVHHFGQAAFKKLIASGEYDVLFENNRRRFEAKWNTEWIPHKNAPLSFEPHSMKK